MKTNQLKLNSNNEKSKDKYYCAFSYLNINPYFKSKLFEFFDFDIEKAWLCDKNDLKSLAEFDCNITIPKNFLQKKSKLDPDECYNQALADKNIKLLTYENEKYPPLLKEIPDFPLSLFYKGNIEEISYEYCLSVVGSRKASTEAKLALNSIISSLDSNITIVSGLAYGIDAAAHTSAINNNLKTIGVIGSGLDVTYPIQNKKIYDDIENGSGVIFSEYPIKTPPLAQNFPQRNRIVVGISKGTLVAEAQIKSGAMISARLAAEYNRELMCIPGNILNPNTSGIYQLIKNGAGIIINANDLLNELNWDIILKEPKSSLKLNNIQKEIIDFLSYESKTFDEIVLSIKTDVSKIMVALTELELKGLIKQSGNKYYKI